MNKLKLWFTNCLKKVAEHNDYTSDMMTVSACDPCGKWTPADLIAREYLNNGAGSAKGFLGITPSKCREAYAYMCENRQTLIDLDLVSKEAWNNHGFPLWVNYNF